MELFLALADIPDNRTKVLIALFVFLAVVVVAGAWAAVNTANFPYEHARRVCDIYGSVLIARNEDGTYEVTDPTKFAIHLRSRKEKPGG